MIEFNPRLRFRTARAQTPNFDELAKTSAVFRQYYVQGNESQTSHSSVWTGVWECQEPTARCRR